MTSTHSTPDPQANNPISHANPGTITRLSPTRLVRSSARPDKEQRRRERRERRARRQLLRPVEEVVRRGPSAATGTNVPDILHSHVPPPYSTLPPNRTNGRALGGPPQRGSRWRQGSAFPAAVTADLTRSHASFFEDNHNHHIHHLDGSSHTSKSCCGVALNQTVSIRWFIVMIAFVGICCSVVGTILGALKASGREHLTVSLLMIGVGIVLITVSGIAWRLTSPEGPSCRTMLGLSSDSDDEYNGRFLSRPSGALPYGGRPQHPYAAMMYSDFQYRPPPPSYQASMQEYRLRLLLMDRNSSSATGGTQVTSAPSGGGGGGPISPPPNYYRSQNNSRMVFDSSQFSRPPSYRSHSSDQNLSAIQESSSSIVIDSNVGGSLGGGSSSCRLSSQPHIISTHPIVHRRQNSSSSTTANGSDQQQQQQQQRPLPDFNQEAKSVFNVLGSLSGPTPTGKDPGKSHVDSNLVTIVQTSESFALSNNNSNSLIVTVSGSLERRPPSSHHPSRNNTSAPLTTSGEVEILAHL